MENDEIKKIVDEFLKSFEMKNKKIQPSNIKLFNGEAILLGARIRMSYKLKGWNQLEFSRQMGKPQYEISRWVTGKYEPTALELKKIAEITGQPIEFFFQK